MLTVSQLLSFLLLAAAVVAIPGPSVMFTIGRALSAGRRAALLTVIGNGAGLAIQATLIAVGVGSVLATVSWALTVLKVVGGAYLVWLGIEAVSHRSVAASAIGARVGAGVRAERSSFRDGVVLGLSNPKTLVFLVAFLPQFVSPATAAHGQMFLLGVAFAALAVLGDSLWAVAAAQARSWLGRTTRRMESVHGAGGVLLIGLGGYTLATGVKTR